MAARPEVLSVLAMVALALPATGSAVPGHLRPAASAVPPAWKNCTNVNRRYPHGVGKAGAHDRTSGTPVTNFKHSTRLYNVAVSYNGGLDRDKDGIACEKR